MILNWSGWQLFIPRIFLLLFYPGTAGKNRFGEYPKGDLKPYSEKHSPTIQKSPNL